MERLVPKTVTEDLGTENEAIADWFQELSRLRSNIEADQREIDRLKVETRRTLDRIEARLDKMQATR